MSAASVTVSPSVMSLTVTQSNTNIAVTTSAIGVTLTTASPHTTLTANAGNPTLAPSIVGSLWYNTIELRLWLAKGNSALSDWVEIPVGGGP